MYTLRYVTPSRKILDHDIGLNVLPMIAGRLLYLIVMLFSVHALAGNEPLVSKETLELRLGKKIFFDPMFSESGATSCASCHQPAFSFADNVSLSERDDELLARVNTPPLFNLQRKIALFQQGQQFSVTEAVKACAQERLQLSVIATYSRLRESEQLKALSNQVYGRTSVGGVYRALSKYVATIKSEETTYDRYLQGYAHALSEEQHLGLRLFKEKGCFFCHSGHDLGGNVRAEKLYPDGTKHVIVPRLRNAVRTAPYFYSGGALSITDAILSMSKKHNGIIVSEQEAKRIVAFLSSHSSELSDFEGPISNGYQD